MSWSDTTLTQALKPQWQFKVLEMIIKAAKKNKLKKDISFCDYCKQNKNDKIMTATGNKRIDTAHELVGNEAICDSCRIILKGL